MAKNTQPILKRCKTLGISPAVLGVNKETNRNPKQSRRKQSEYAMKQFRTYYKKAEKMEGKAGENLLILLETRLDNVVYRLGFAKTRREARQLTSHGHFTVNGQKVDIASYRVKPGDVIAVREKSRSSAKFKALVEELGATATPKWLEKEKDSFEGKVIAMPQRDDIDYEVAEHLIVELYSK